jgi:uncharacterized protein
MKTIDFNPLKVKDGEKKWGFVNVLDCLAIKLDLPVMIVKGTKEGPTFVVTAGLYPTEYCGVEAAGRIYQQLDPKHLQGKVIIIPVVNMPVFRFRTPMFSLAKSLSPMDGKDMTKVFPGNPTGTISEVLAYKLFNDFIIGSNYHVDLRGGELYESHLQHTIFLQIGKELDKTMKHMGVIFGLPYALPTRIDIGHSQPTTLIYEAVNLGIASIISQSGLGYNTQPKENEVMGHVNGVMNLLKYFKMMDGEPVKPKTQHFLLPDRPPIFAPESGIFKTFVDQGDLLTKGQLMGTICDLDNEEICQIKSPFDNAVIHEMMPKRVVYKGDRIFQLAIVSSSTGFSLV